LTLRRRGQHRLTHGAERSVKMAVARVDPPFKLVSRDVGGQLPPLSVRVRRRPGAAAVRQPVEAIAGDHEQPQRRGELCLDAAEAGPVERELEQGVFVLRRGAQQLERVLCARFL